MTPAGAPDMQKVVVGAPVDRAHSYILDKFLQNQAHIQQIYPCCELVLSTSDKGYAPQLKNMLEASKLRGIVLTHEVLKPDYARHWIWDIAGGREAIRRYAVSQAGAGYLLFLDADMLFDTDIIINMGKCIEGYDAVFNGYALRGHGTGLAGAGCVMLNRRVFENINMRCCEFKNGDVIYEDNLLEMDLFRLHARIRKGIFVASEHYQDAASFKRLEPQPVGKIRLLVNHPLWRYILIGSSLMLHYNLPWRLRLFLEKFDKG
jgi:hypothetical protein